MQDCLQIRSLKWIHECIYYCCFCSYTELSQSIVFYMTPRGISCFITIFYSLTSFYNIYHWSWFSVKFQVIAHGRQSPVPARLQNSRYAVENSYELAELHIHWGNANNRGSEHSLDGRYYPAEVSNKHLKRKILTWENSFSFGILGRGRGYEHHVRRSFVLDSRTIWKM